MPRDLGRDPRTEALGERVREARIGLCGRVDAIEEELAHRAPVGETPQDRQRVEGRWQRARGAVELRAEVEQGLLVLRAPAAGLEVRAPDGDEGQERDPALLRAAA